jgi:hypothetical protein
MPMDWIKKKSCTRFDRSNSIDLGTHNEMESLENLTHSTEDIKLLMKKQSSWRWFKVQRLICLNLSWHWIAPQDHGMYPTWWNPLRCVRRAHHCGHVGYKATKPTTCDCHLTQKNMTKEKIQVMIFKKEALKLLILGSPMGIPTHLICFPKKFFSFLVHWRDIEDLVSFTITCLKCLFHLQNVYLQLMMHNLYGNHLAQNLDGIELKQGF